MDSEQTFMEELKRNRESLMEHTEWIQQHFDLHTYLNQALKNETQINENNILLIKGLEEEMANLRKIIHFLMIVIFIICVILFADLLII